MADSNGGSVTVVSCANVTREMFIPTRSSRLRPGFGTSCETVFYEQKKPKKVVSTEDNKKEVVKNERRKRVTGKHGKSEKDDWNMKKLRYDIIKFGTTGFSGAKKEESKIALAVSLGAQPPKNKYVNYKEILKSKAAEKQEKTKLKKLNRDKNLKKQKYKSTVKDKNGTKQLLDVYGKVQRRKPH